MSSFPLRLLGLVLVSAFALASPAEAAKSRNIRRLLRPRLPVLKTGVRTWFLPARFILAVCTSATIPIRTSVSRSCAISAAGLAATVIDCLSSVSVKALVPFDFCCLIG
jgi:hypothetical protein